MTSDQTLMSPSHEETKAAIQTNTVTIRLETSEKEAHLLKPSIGSLFKTILLVTWFAIKVAKKSSPPKAKPNAKLCGEAESESCSKTPVTKH